MWLFCVESYLSIRLAARHGLRSLEDVGARVPIHGTWPARAVDAAVRGAPAKSGVREARRAGKRQAAPFAKGDVLAVQGV